MKVMISALCLSWKFTIVKGLYAITPNQILNVLLIQQMLERHQPYALQYRHKTDDAQLKLSEANELKQLCASHNTVFMINDDINLAQKVQADGVHLGKNDGSIHSARERLGVQSIIGVSCYNDLDLALRAQDQGADYVAFGALFKSKTKPEAAYCAPEVLRAAKAQLEIPIVGIGGIDFDNQAQAFAQGCDAVAMINALYE